jgi:hypothetical protein
MHHTSIGFVSICIFGLAKKEGLCGISESLNEQIHQNCEANVGTKNP